MSWEISHLLQDDVFLLDCLNFDIKRGFEFIQIYGKNDARDSFELLFSKYNLSEAREFIMKFRIYGYNLQFEKVHVIAKNKNDFEFEEKKPQLDNVPLQPQFKVKENYLNNEIKGTINRTSLKTVHNNKEIDLYLRDNQKEERASEKSSFFQNEKPKTNDYLHSDLRDQEISDVSKVVEKACKTADNPYNLISTQSPVDQELCKIKNTDQEIIQSDSRLRNIKNISSAINNKDIQKKNDDIANLKNAILEDEESDLVFQRKMKKSICYKNSFNLDFEEDSKGCKRLKKIKENVPNPSFCPICYLDGGDNIAVIDNCVHQFCYPCIKEWSKVTNLCPLCKKEFHEIKNYEKGKVVGVEKVAPKKQTHEEVQGSEDELIANADNFCYFCEQEGDANYLLICDNCNLKCCHTSCLDPPLAFVPQDEWYCDFCFTNFNIRGNNPIANIFSRNRRRRRRNQIEAEERTLRVPSRKNRRRPHATQYSDEEDQIENPPLKIKEINPKCIKKSYSSSDDEFTLETTSPNKNRHNVRKSSKLPKENKIENKIIENGAFSVFNYNSNNNYKALPPKISEMNPDMIEELFAGISNNSSTNVTGNMVNTINGSQQIVSGVNHLKINTDRRPRERTEILSEESRDALNTAMIIDSNRNSIPIRLRDFSLSSQVSDSNNIQTNNFLEFLNSTNNISKNQSRGTNPTTTDHARDGVQISEFNRGTRLKRKQMEDISKTGNDSERDKIGHVEALNFEKAFDELQNEYNKICSNAKRN